jgi:hypothetical protein
MSRPLKLPLFLAAAVSALAGVTVARGESLDGTWTGGVGLWTIKLIVNGPVADFTLDCPGGNGSGPYRWTVPITSDGRIDEWLKAPGLSRRHYMGQLPHLFISNELSSCGGGNATLRKS